MKRKIAMLLAALTVCSFASCGDADKDDDEKDEVSVSESAEDEDADEQPEDESSEKQDDKNDESSDDESSDDESSDDESSDDESSDDGNSDDEIGDDESSAVDNSSDSKSDLGTAIAGLYDTDFEDFEFGTVDGNVYSSSFCGLEFTAPDNFVFLDQDEILSLMNISFDMVGGDNADLYKTIAQQTTVYDMVAKNAITGDNVIVMFENLAAYGDSVAEAYDVDTYIQAIDLQMQNLESSGMTYNKKDISTAELGGQEFTKVDFDLSVDEPVYTVTQSYYVAKNGNYMTVICISSGALGDGDVSKIEKCFSAYTE